MPATHRSPSEDPTPSRRERRRKKGSPEPTTQVKFAGHARVAVPARRDAKFRRK
ncbi:hypothetical protein ACWDSJ_18515 [Nocardia sp. NPDC003482]